MDIDNSKKLVILDIEFISGKSLATLKGYNSTHMLVGTTNLKLESIRCLVKDSPKYTKKRGTRTKEEYTRQLFEKIALFPFSKYSHMDLVALELFEEKTIIQKNDFLNYVTPCPLLEFQEKIDFISNVGEDEQIKLWKNGDFKSNVGSSSNTSGYAIANGYNRLRIGELKDYYKNIKKANSQVPIKEIINQTKNFTHKNLFCYIEHKNLFGFRDNLERTRQKEKIINLMKFRRLDEFAPYTAYVITLTQAFEKNILLEPRINLKSTELESDWMDFNYTYYFPFIDYIASNDKFFRSLLSLEEYNFFGEKIAVMR